MSNAGKVDEEEDGANTSSMSNTLVKALSDALRSGIEKPDLPAYAANMPNYAEVFYDCRVATAEKSFRDVEAALKELPELAVFGNEISCFDGQFIRHPDISQWLLAQTRKYGDPKQISEKFLSFLSTNTTELLFVLVLNGLTADKEIELINGVSLIPIIKLPPSMMKDSVEPKPDARPMLGSPNYDCPSAALVMKGKVNPVFLRKDQSPTWDFPNADHLQFVRLALTLVGPRATAAVSSWAQIVGEGPPVTLNASSSYYLGEGSINKRYALLAEPFDVNHARDVLTWFHNLHTTNRDVFEALLIPLSRLNRAIRHFESTDRAIDLGIALESLLLDGDDGELSFRLCSRGAWLLGQDVNDRERLFQLLNLLYQLRSSAVHGGTFGTKLIKKLPSATDGRLRQPDQILWDGIKLCAAIIEIVLQKGTFPNWRRITLGDAS